MKQIKNIVFDFGGVIISFDREQAVKAFERIGVREAAVSYTHLTLPTTPYV